MIFLVLCFFLVLLTLAACRVCNRFWLLQFLIFFRLQGNVTIDLISFFKRLKCFFSLILLPFLAAFVLVLCFGIIFRKKGKYFSFFCFFLWVWLFYLFCLLFFWFLFKKKLLLFLCLIFWTWYIWSWLWFFIWWFNFIFF